MKPPLPNIKKYKGLKNLILFLEACDIKWYNESYNDRFIVGMENHSSYWQWNTKGEFEKIIYP